MFELYFRKKDFEMKIRKSNKNIKGIIEDEKVYNFNDCIVIATNRKILREYAKQLKDKWLQEKLEEIEKIKAIEIKTKY